MLLVGACKSKGFEPPPAWELGGQTAGYHEGPMVAAGDEGPRYGMNGLLAAWLAGAQSEVDCATAPEGWQSLAVAHGELWILEGELGAKARTLVVHVADDGPVWQSVCRGLAAWNDARLNVQIVEPSNRLVLGRGAPEGLLMELEQRAAVPFAWITVEQAENGELTLLRGPDPLRPWGELAPAEEVQAPDLSDPNVQEREVEKATFAPQEGPAHGLAVVLRMALVDVGLVARPWKSRERPFDGWAFGVDLASMGIAHARLQLGSSGLDLKKSDQPRLSEEGRAMLALYSGLQALLAPSPSDLERYLRSLKLEMRLRQNQEEPEVGLRWMAWLRGARGWLREIVLGL